ncbi:thymidine phosphorylase [Thalassovita mangrovi]|uniref:Thymidine phosphorylase n=1 Tax=Thalassovita mangrovi TaxID=2692236 RepID=A0A6L8LQR5_9RHOB|nr:thymidine phosphorylase [Thalassovita mangrovi]MYM57446.1 thymidine phosphorylase [Thalassovita mangrovi]
MDARAIIAKVRDRQPVSRDELNWFAQGLADRAVSDAQAGAFAMAALLNGLDEEGRVGLTLAMRDSGDVLKWDMDRPVLDKHSTGGVGDCVSLVLAPALAVCGAYVPMISGRGLGHTGGTLDKLEAIPGYRTDLSEAQFRDVVGKVGCSIVSASGDIAPADKRLYAIRDVSATVESLDLITASILSKKLAAGLEGLVLDVKVGTGAFMKSAEDARALAQALVTTANAAGCQTSALITDMNQPLAPELGNALEVASSMRVLTGLAQGPLLELTNELGGVALANAGLAKDAEEGAEKIAAAIADGRAAECFGRMVAAQGGPVQFVDNWQRFLPEAPVIREVLAPKAGYVSAMDGQALGLAVVELGGGRQVESDVVDPAVGISDVLPRGTKVAKGQPLARIHAAREGAADVACASVLSAVTIASKAPDLPPLVHERIG